jgi:hypothetical protein
VLCLVSVQKRTSSFLNTTISHSFLEENMNIPKVDNTTVWRRLALVAVLLFLLVGPNFGPIPTLLSQHLSIEASVVALLASFWIGFCIIVAVILRMSGGMPLREMLRSLGLGAPSRGVHSPLVQEPDYQVAGICQYIEPPGAKSDGENHDAGPMPGLPEMGPTTQYGKQYEGYCSYDNGGKTGPDCNMVPC